MSIIQTPKNSSSSTSVIAATERKLTRQKESRMTPRVSTISFVTCDRASCPIQSSLGPLMLPFLVGNPYAMPVEVDYDFSRLSSRQHTAY
jgi:hypothetical protein